MNNQQSAFGATNTNTSGFGGFGSTTTNNASGSVFGSSSNTNSGGGLFGSSSTSTSAFGQSSSNGTGNPPYQKTVVNDNNGTLHYQAITAMPAYESKSFEELRSEDYGRGNKGGGMMNSATGNAFGAGGKVSCVFLKGLISRRFRIKHIVRNIFVWFYEQ